MTGVWSDLPARLISAAVLIAVGGAGVWVGGIGFALVVCAACGAMLWELGRMLKSRHAVLLGLLGTSTIMSFANPALSALYQGIHISILGAVFVLVFRNTNPALRIWAGWYSASICVAGLALIWLRQEFGLLPIVWLLGVVIAADIAGYVVGRWWGGTKFWPAISPNKTWSGTLAGWIAAVVVGLGVLISGQGGMILVLLSPLVALAGQMGDITESWFKRGAGVKDSSRLIPGHGGVLDRFDALVFASLMVGAIAWAAPSVLRG